MPALVATGEELPFLTEIVTLLAVSVGILLLCHRFRIVPITGFLVAGMLLGPNGLGFVEDLGLVQSMAELGVILLLFTIGVEFRLDKLLQMGRFLVVGGGLQVVVTAVATMLLLLAVGTGAGAALFTGFLVALSSTAIVLKLLADRAATESPAGRLTVAILIFQDLAVVAMALLVPMLAGAGGTWGEAVVALVKAGLLIAVLLVVARRVVPWLLELVVRTRGTEIFLLAVVALCFGIAWATSLAGVSLALGAFLAGLVVSESRYSAYALSEVLPLRTVFNAIFFVSVGMLVDASFLAGNLPFVLAIALAVALLKAVVSAGAVLALRLPARIAVMAGLNLAQIGEFSFVLDRLGRSMGLSPGGLGARGEQTFLAVTALLMLGTPLLTRLGHRLGEWLGRRAIAVGERETVAPPDAKLEDHVIVIGYGPAGRRLGRVLEATNIPFLVVELNPRSVREAEEDGHPALYGDASRPHLLHAAGVEKAKLCVVAINDHHATRRIVHVAHAVNPTLRIIVRTRFLADVEPLLSAGADRVVPEELETSLRIFAEVLEDYQVPAAEIRRHIEAIREADYAAFRSRAGGISLELPAMDERGVHTRTVTVREGATAAGRTLGELQLRQAYGVTAVAVHRGAESTVSPDGAFRLEAGDRLVLLGSAGQFETCGHLFRAFELDGA